jgi:hypothetical protein
MHSDVFYATAATVIPLLLISVMATRSLKPGELQQLPTITILMFGLPVLGEIATFAYLFFEPTFALAAAILAVLTWAGLLSQLGLATWWLADLISSETHKMAIGRSKAKIARICPMCGGTNYGPGKFCTSCGASQSEATKEAVQFKSLGETKRVHIEPWLLDTVACPACRASRARIVAVMLGSATARGVHPRRHRRGEHRFAPASGTPLGARRGR